MVKYAVKEILLWCSVFQNGGDTKLHEIRNCVYTIHKRERKCKKNLYVTTLKMHEMRLLR